MRAEAVEDEALREATMTRETSSGAPVLDWTPDKAKRFGDAILTFRHGLHERPLFTDEGLASVIDRYPREKLGVFTMGEDLTDWTSWRRGSAGTVPGERLLRMVQAGRLWLNLRDTNLHLPEFAALCDEIAADKERALGRPILKRDLGLLISSPNAQVLYHLDVPLSSLWQIRGQKHLSLYPRAEPYVSDAEIERFVMREGEGQFAYDTAWDGAATTITLNPGHMVTWRQNAPHQVANGPMMNVSLSMEFMTPAAIVRANVLYANGVLRRRLGWSPRVQDRPGPTLVAKLALARALKAAEARRPAYTPILKPSFVLEDRG